MRLRVVFSSHVFNDPSSENLGESISLTGLNGKIILYGLREKDIE